MPTKVQTREEFIADVDAAITEVEAKIAQREACALELGIPADQITPEQFLRWQKGQQKE